MIAILLGALVAFGVGTSHSLGIFADSSEKYFLL